MLKITFCRRATNEINDNESKQQLDTYLKALVPLEECLKSPPIPTTTTVSTVNEQQTDPNHRHQRRTNGTKGKISCCFIDH